MTKITPNQYIPDPSIQRGKITTRIEKGKFGVSIIIENDGDEDGIFLVNEDELPAIRDAIDSYLKQKEA